MIPLIHGPLICGYRVSDIRNIARYKKYSKLGNITKKGAVSQI